MFRTPLGHAVSLSPREGSGSIVPQWDPVTASEYLAPDGDWLVSVGATGGGGDVMLGLSGSEFMRVARGSFLRFVSSSPAFAPHFGGTGTTFTDAATTSWVYAKDPESMTGPESAYYAQPNEGAFFSPLDQLLQPLDIPAGRLNGTLAHCGAPEASFPAVPYTAITATGETSHVASLALLMQRFETEILASARRLIMQASTGPISPPVVSLTAASLTAVSQQGLVARFSTDLFRWEKLVLAESGRGGQSLCFTAIGDTMRAALLANQLYLVVTNPKALTTLCSTTFRLTEASRADATEPPYKIPAATVAKTKTLTATYMDLEQFSAALREALSEEEFQNYHEHFARLAETAQLTISGWTFDLAPRRWHSNTVMILKIGDHDLINVLGDTACWTMPKAFNAGDLSEISRRLLKIYADAETRTDLGDFLKTRRSWNGVLYLNCYITSRDFPPELQGLAAGIPSGKLLAHHIGASLSPVMMRKGVIVTTDASLFAAINYSPPPEPLTYQESPFAFKVDFLRVAFKNSEISDFASQLELLVAELFGEPSLLQGTQGGILTFEGIWQKQGDRASYSFVYRGNNLFGLGSNVTDTATLRSARFITCVPDSDAPEDATVRTRFILSGTLRFKALELDVFSFGSDAATEDLSDPPGLGFVGLTIEMAFARSAPDKPKFGLDTSQMSFDVTENSARETSLVRRFPLQIKAIQQGNAQLTPSQLGFMQVTSTLRPGSLGAVWFGLVLDLNLGGAGGLASSVDLKAQTLLAWAPSNNGPNVFVGLKFPGSQGGAKTIEIEGPLKISIGDITLHYNVAEKGYMIKLSKLALSVFGLQFPQGGQHNLLLFGDPDHAHQNTSLGWYFAYKSDKDTGPEGRR
jgi:hypothetical protein